MDAGRMATWTIWRPRLEAVSGFLFCYNQFRYPRDLPPRHPYLSVGYLSHEALAGQGRVGEVELLLTGPL
jgi:hypothetical protein